MTDDEAAAWAKVISEVCFRNSILERLHTGKAPSSETGDYSDVKVVTPYGEIPWNELSRFNNDEMRDLMMDVVDRVFTYLKYPEQLTYAPSSRRWREPSLHQEMMMSVRRP